MGTSVSNLTDVLYRVEQQRRALLAEALAPKDLNMTQWVALCALTRAGASSMTELAQASAIDRTSLTRTIDGLIPRGLVARYTPPRDRRTVMVEASIEGKRLTETVSNELSALETRWYAGLATDEQLRLTQDLERLLGSLPEPDRKAVRHGEGVNRRR